jgi:hypothetical protein
LIIDPKQSALNCQLQQWGVFFVPKPASQKAPVAGLARLWVLVGAVGVASLPLS